MTDTTLERMAQAINNTFMALTEDGGPLDWRQEARAALQSLSPPSPAVERAVALASCGRSACLSGYPCKDTDCALRARLTVEALVKAVLGEIKTGRGK